MIEHALTTTAFTLDGYRIVKTLGVVRGVTVRSRSLFGTIGGALQTLVGGDITLFTDLCEKTREILSVAPDFIRDFHFSRDREWLFLARGAQEADLWLATMK